MWRKRMYDRVCHAVVASVACGKGDVLTHTADEGHEG